MITKNCSEFPVDITILAIAAEKNESLKKFRDENGFKIILLGDRRRKVVKAYNVFRFIKVLDLPYGKMKNAVPATFLINKNGEIAWNYVGSRTDRPTIGQMKQAIAENLP